MKKRFDDAVMQISSWLDGVGEKKVLLIGMAIAGLLWAIVLY